MFSSTTSTRREGVRDPVTRPAWKVSPAPIKPIAGAISLAFSISLLSAPAAHAQASANDTTLAQSAAQQPYDIPAGPLAPALHGWAKSSDVMLTFTADQTDGRTTAGLRGRYTPQAALNALLKGTGLQSIRWDDGSFGLKKLTAAQSQAPAPEAVALAAAGTSGESQLPAVKVTARAPESNTLQSEVHIARMMGPVQEIPQVVNVVPQEVLKEQQATTLEQALRNVPGITVAIGEANGGANGDQFRIRGSTAKNDAYLDGLRDFGVYVRDTFNTEQIDVVKGPSSENFGMGSSGGAINSESKLAQLGNSAEIEGMIGNGPMNRETVDVNHQIGQTTAIRVNAMRQDQDIVGRNGVKSDRSGVAVSLGMGLGTPTTWYLNYMHQQNDRTPDYGQPLIGRTATDVREPVASAWGINRSNYYGKDSDRDHTKADIFTSLFTHKFNDSTTLSNDTRLGYYERGFTTTTSTCDQACANTFLGTGDATYVLGSGGGPRYAQRDLGVENITTLATKFETGPLKHDARIGLDIAYETDHRQQYAYMRPDLSGTTTKIPGTLLNPNTSSSNYVVAIDPRGTNDVRESSLTNAAVFASDRVWFTPQWSVLGSVRWDYYGQSSKLSTLSTGAVAGDVETNSNFFSPKLSVIWEPTSRQTYYLSYGWASTTPWAGSISADANPLGVNSTTAASNALRNLDPEKTRTLELGGKVDILKEQLGLTGALFRTDKTNTYYDDGSGNFIATGNKERYYGIELGLTGNITPQWTAYLGYMFLHSEITDSATRTNIGNPVQGAAKNSATLWTTYDLKPLLAAKVPGRIVIGGGVTYRDAMTIRDDAMAKVPYSLSVDAMIAYEYKNVRIALNGYNLTNRINYDQYFAGENANTARATPSAGRAVILSTRIAM